MTDTPKTDTLASRILWLLGKRKMTQSDLCRATRTKDAEALTTPSMWALTSGKTKEIKADTLFRIAAALRASPSWILSGDGDPFDMCSSNAEDEGCNLYRALPADKQAMILAAIKAIANN